MIKFMAAPVIEIVRLEKSLKVASSMAERATTMDILEKIYLFC